MEDNQTYLVEGELTFRSYEPAHLKVGMHFLTRINVGLIEPEFLFFTLEHVPEDEELFMSLYGTPVHLFIISADGDEEEYATPNQIGWFNDEKDEALRPIGDREINEIINRDEGYLDIETDETGDIILYDGKVIISYLSETEEEEDEP